MSRVATMRRDIVRKIRQVGLLETIKHGFRKLGRAQEVEKDAFDAEFGTDTAKIVSVGALDIPEEKLEHTNRYEAVVPELFERIIEALPLRHEDFTFIDIGSGKGRALLLASRFSFRRIIGVELSAALTRTAQRNLAIFKDPAQKCRRIEAVCSDASEYCLPNEPLVLYLNNPFDGDVMRPFVCAVERSFKECPRKVFVIYQRPLHRECWEGSGCFRLVREAERYIFFESALIAQ